MITITKDPVYLFYSGATFTIEWYFDEAGKMKAKEYYENLSDEDKNRLRYIVKHFADSPIGTRLPGKLYKLEDADNKIYAFKPGDFRFFNFMTEGRKIIIIDAYRKHSQQMAKKDLNQLKTVIETKGNYLYRIKAGTYYERVT